MVLRLKNFDFLTASRRIINLEDDVVAKLGLDGIVVIVDGLVDVDGLVVVLLVAVLVAILTLET